MKKRICSIFVIVGIIFILSGCKNNVKSEKEIMLDLPSETKGIYINICYYNEDGSENIKNSEWIELEIDSLKIEKRQTNEKDDTVYCNVIMKNDMYQYKVEYILYYNFYDEGGWILDNYESQNGTILALNGLTKAVADDEMDNYYFDTFEFKENNFDEEDQMASIIYNVDYDSENCSYHGLFSMDYMFNSEGVSGTWYCDNNYHDEFEWNIIDNWAAEPADFSPRKLLVGGHDVEIKDVVAVDANNYEVNLDATRYQYTSLGSLNGEENYSGLADAYLDFEEYEGGYKIIGDDYIADIYYGVPKLVIKYEIGEWKDIKIVIHPDYARIVEEPRESGDLHKGYSYQ